MRVARSLDPVVPVSTGLSETQAVRTSPASSNPSSPERRQSIDFTLLLKEFKSGSWIWTGDLTPPLFATGPCDRFFRRTYNPPKGKTVVQAEALITADNAYSLFLNGALVGTGGAWQNAQGYRMTLDHADLAVFAVKATNTDAWTLFNLGGTSAAGLLAVIHITHSDGSDAFIHSDATWYSNVQPFPDFQLPTTDDSRWSPAVVLTKFGTGPWGTSNINIPLKLDAVSIPPLPKVNSPTSAPSSSPPTLSATVISTQPNTPLAPSDTNLSVQPSATTPGITPIGSTGAGTATTVNTTNTVNTAPSGTVTATTTIAAAPNGSASTVEKLKSNKAVLLGAILGSVIAVLLLSFLLLYWRRRRNQKIKKLRHRTAEPYIMYQRGYGNNGDGAYGKQQGPHTMVSASPQMDDYQPPPPYAGNDDRHSGKGSVRKL